MQASMKLGEAMYAAQQADTASSSDDVGSNKEEDVIDADFREVNEDDQKKKRN